MDILRFITAGNIDDGKSTLIGRLLYDTSNLKKDVLDSVSDPQTDQLNLAYITDGLRTEREQGITIDVAYKYFTTKERKYIITDAPGHFQYTKNLVTGASNADLIIILIDAKNGITQQTKRHSLVAAFLGISHVVVAINKMDIVGYDVAVFDSIKNQYEIIASKLNLTDITYIPISALLGDNVSFHSANTPWYSGNTIEESLAKCIPAKPNTTLMRFSVQHTAEMNGDDLIFGKVMSGKLMLHDMVAILPQDDFGMILKMWENKKEVDQVEAGQNVCMVIGSQKKIVRGNLISYFNLSAICGTDINANICWLDENPLIQEKIYYLRIHALETLAKVTAVEYKIDISSFEAVKTSEPVRVNELARVTIKTEDLIVYDSFSILQETGRGILIDPDTNNTVAAFTIE